MRKVKNFIDSFIEYTSGRGSPKIYRKWTGIFILSAIMERKTWLTTARGRLYPNQYILLVGGAGIGKSLCTNAAYDLLTEASSIDNPLHIAPTSVTRASLIDNLANAERRIIRPMETPSVISFNSLAIIPNEFGVFLPSWEGDFMSTLTDLWDCGRYSETRRTAKIAIDLPNTQLNMLSATTPAYLNNLLPEGAWEHGFMSRVLVVYSGEATHTDLFLQLDHDTAMFKNLCDDLRQVYSMWGEFSIEDDVKEAINAWSKAGGPPIPDHPKLTSYCARRAAHLLKLCMVASAAGDNDRIVTLDHFSEALDWLVELETFMPDVFKSMKAGGDARAIEECWHFCYQIWMKSNEPVPEHRIFHFLQERVPAHNIERILEVMQRASLLQKQFTNSGGIGFIPKSKQV